MTTHTRLLHALATALLAGWRVEDIEGLLQGPMRYADGFPVACCSVCLKPEYIDGLIATEEYDVTGATVMSGEMCPQCVSGMRSG